MVSDSALGTTGIEVSDCCFGRTLGITVIEEHEQSRVISVSAEGMLVLKVSETPEGTPVMTVFGGMVVVSVSAEGMLVLSVSDMLVGASVIAGCDVLAVLAVSDSGYWMLGGLEE